MILIIIYLFIILFICIKSLYQIIFNNDRLSHFYEILKINSIIFFFNTKKINLLGVFINILLFILINSFINESITLCQDNNSDSDSSDDYQFKYWLEQAENKCETLEDNIYKRRVGLYNIFENNINTFTQKCKNELENIDNNNTKKSLNEIINSFLILTNDLTITSNNLVLLQVENKNDLLNINMSSDNPCMPKSMYKECFTLMIESLNNDLETISKGDIFLKESYNTILTKYNALPIDAKNNHTDTVLKMNQAVNNIKKLEVHKNNINQAVNEVNIFQNNFDWTEFDIY